MAGKENASYKREFRFVNPKCQCNIEKSLDDHDRIKVKISDTTSNKHKFIFIPGREGLIDEKNRRVTDQKTGEKIVVTSPMTEFWELGEYDETYTDRLANYIKKYGFFWPISKNTKNILYSYELFLVINRLRRLHELFDILALYEILDAKLNPDEVDLYISNMENEKAKIIDPVRLFSLTFFYIFSVHVILPYEYDKSIVPIETCSYSYGDAWWYPKDVKLKCYDINKNAKKINSEKVEELEDESKIFFIPLQEEYFYRRHHQIQRCFRDRLSSSRWKNENDEMNFPYDFSGEKIDEISEGIDFLYKAIPLEDKEGRRIADFLYTFIQRVSEIKMISPDGTIELESPDNFSDNRKFSSGMKKELVDIAKMIYRKEINWGIQNIRPIYGEHFSYEWEIPDYLSALYFAHCLTTPNDPELRKCANPACVQYFLVNRLNFKFKYHNESCEHAINSQQSRNRKDNSTELIK